MQQDDLPPFVDDVQEFVASLLSLGSIDALSGAMSGKAPALLDRTIDRLADMARIARGHSHPEWADETDLIREAIVYSRNPEDWVHRSHSEFVTYSMQLFLSQTLDQASLVLAAAREEVGQQDFGRLLSLFSFIGRHRAQALLYQEMSMLFLPPARTKTLVETFTRRYYRTDPAYVSLARRRRSRQMLIDKSSGYQRKIARSVMSILEGEHVRHWAIRPEERLFRALDSLIDMASRLDSDLAGAIAAIADVQRGRFSRDGGLLDGQPVSAYVELNDHPLYALAWKVTRGEMWPGDAYAKVPWHARRTKAQDFEAFFKYIALVGPEEKRFADGWRREFSDDVRSLQWSVVSPLHPSFVHVLLRILGRCVAFIQGEGIAGALLQMLGEYEANAHFDESARRAYESAIVILERCDPSYELVRAQLGMARVFRAERDLVSAGERVTRALEVARRLGQGPALIDALVESAELSAQRKDWVEAERLWKEVGTLEQSDEQVISTADVKLTEVLIEAGQVVRARQILEAQNAALQEKLRMMKGPQEHVRVISGLAALVSAKLSSVLRACGEMKSALENAERGVSNARGVGDLKTLGFCLTELGKCQRVIGDSEAAVKTNEEARAISHSLGSPKDELADIGNLIFALDGSGDLERMINLAREGLNVARSIGDLDQVGAFASFIAELAMRQGDWKTALEACQAIQGLSERLPKAEDMAAVLLGDLHMHTGHPDVAQELYTQVLVRDPLEQSGDSHVDLLIKRARARFLLGATADTLRDAEDALSRIRALPNGDKSKELEVALLYARSLPASEENDRERARIASDTLKSARVIGDHENAAVARAVLGALKVIHGRHSDAERLLAEAYADLESSSQVRIHRPLPTSMKVGPLLIGVQNLRLLHFLRAGDAAGAFAMADLACARTLGEFVRRYSALPSSVPAELRRRYRAAIVGEEASLAPEVPESSPEQGADVGRGGVYAAQAARVLREKHAKEMSHAEKRNLENLIRELERYVPGFSAIHAGQLRSAHAAGEPFPASVAVMQFVVMEAGTAVLLRLPSEQLDLTDLKINDPTPIGSAGHNTPPSTCPVERALGLTPGRAWISGQSSYSAAFLSFNFFDLIPLAVEWRRSNENSHKPSGRDVWLETVARVLSILHQRLVTPIGDLLGKLRSNGIHELVVEPHDLLNLFPLASLLAHPREFGLGSPTSALFTVSVAPSFGIWSDLRKRSAPSAASGTAVFQGLAFSPLDAPLPFPELEVASIGAMFPLGIVELSLGREATANALLTSRGSKFVHCASHARYAMDSPVSSGLELSGGGSSESVTVGLLDVMRKGDFTSARLVVLSGCETAVTDVGRLATEYVGIPFAFIYAGASQVLCSTWKVTDLATALFMHRFYELLLEPNADGREGDVGSALRTTQGWMQCQTKGALVERIRKMCEDGEKDGGPRSWECEMACEEIRSHEGAFPFAHPYYWAGFQLVGSRTEDVGQSIGGT